MYRSVCTPFIIVSHFHPVLTILIPFSSKITLKSILICAVFISLSELGFYNQFMVISEEPLELNTVG